MKASLQSNAAMLDLDRAAGAYHDTAKIIGSSWRMPDYTLEYVLQRKADFPSLDNNKGPDLRPSPAAGSKAQEPSAQTATISALPTSRVDAVLTPRQRDVFDLIVQGMSNKEIARALQLAEGTVKIHIKALFAKLGVRRRAAVAVAGTRLLPLSEQGSY